jgi:predicted 3-demethylubiquinone-9 3-methyltransferase (glyoxalase superfamily)
MDIKQKVTPFFCFKDGAEEAIEFYTSLFPDGRIVSMRRYEEGPNEGKVLWAEFELCGQRFMALDGGPDYDVTGFISLYVDCEDQAEVDRLWEGLIEGGGEPLMCGWCTDRYGVHWQIIPQALPRLMNDPDRDAAAR